MRAFLMVGAVLALAATAGAQAPEPAADTCIEAGRLIAEPGRPATTNQTIRVRGDRIVAVEPGFGAQGCAVTIDQRAHTVLPGLVDSHVHITGERNPNERLERVTNSKSDEVINGALFARRTVEAGFTTVVDLGADPEVVNALRNGIAQGKIPGPRIVAAGRSVSAQGGHGDSHGYRQEVLDAFPRWNVCSGADDCRRATREAIRRGADVVKVTATGGVLSNTAAGVGQQLTDEELKAIVDAARSMGRRVSAHAHGVDGINAALRAGVESIEHGTYLDQDSIRLFRQTGAYLVPTVMAGETVALAAEDPESGLTQAQRDKARAVGPLMLDMLRRARAGGVKVAFGTDSGVSRHGENAREFELMVEAGFTPAEALRTATVAAADHLRLPDIGVIAPGKSADVIAVEGDPLSNISALRNVRLVMARGRIAKQD